MPTPFSGNRRLSLAALMLLAPLLAATTTQAATPPCNPCAGITVDNAADWLEPLAAPPALTTDARLYVAWTVAPGDDAAAATTAAVAKRGAVPWLRVRFATPSPLTANAQALGTELAALATLATNAAAKTHFQIEWQGSDTTEYAFLFKRAAVALTGVDSEIRVISRPFAALDAVDAFYAEEVAAYVDGIALTARDGGSLAAAVEHLTELDPGKTIVVQGTPLPQQSERALVTAARLAAEGVSIAFFAAGAPSAETLAPLKILAVEFQGSDLAYDPYSASADSGAWSFVRGEDLALRVIVDRAGGRERIDFADSTLRQPTSVDPLTGNEAEIFGIGRTANGLSFPLDGEAEVAVLRLARPDLADLVGEGGLAEEVLITTERTIPVAEILRRLQANEDAQARTLDHYEAVNTTHLRFQGSSGIQTVEATFEGSFFFKQGQPYDWAWETFYVNGVKWRGKRIPEIPLVEPDKAASLPLEINFGRDYSYRLRGTDIVDGRDCWVVDFEPTGNRRDGKTEDGTGDEAQAETSGNRYQGTVFVDRQLFLRVRSRALQIGLTGEVISNEETLFYSPLDTEGGESSWEEASYTLPLRVVSQQVFSVLNGTTNVEREALMTHLSINAEGFAERREALFSSDTTIVRDTDKGLRYLVPDKETGERVVQDEFDKSRLFLVGGVFHDESLDFPLPLGGINFFSFDYRGTGTQVNLFFAGVLANGTISDPDFLGSRWDAGIDAFFLGIPFTNSIFRDGEEIDAEDVDLATSNIAFTLGRPVGSFLKLNAEYRLSRLNFSTADDSADEFVIPQDHLLNSLGLAARYARNGYRLRLAGSVNKRSDWEFWGLPDADFDPETEEFSRWSLTLAKNFHLKRFQRIGVELEHRGGDQLDRFSKYQFGIFSDSQVHGYQSGLVRAEEVSGFHTSYGFEIGEVFRLELVGDALWATDIEDQLDNELLGGIGIAGTFIGPWQTVVNLDLGVPVAGPDDDGFTLFLAFLKLFER